MNSSNVVNSFLSYLASRRRVKHVLLGAGNFSVSESKYFYYGIYQIHPIDFMNAHVPTDMNVYVSCGLLPNTAFDLTLS